MKFNLIAAAIASIFLGFAPQSIAQSNADHATFTHGESKRCESMSGADKDQCDKEEATKTQGDAAREASKSEPSK
jgi:hypothetical protein